MNVGVCQIRLRLPENHSLKGKRGVVKSITGRVRSKFDVAVAETGDLDAWQRATIAVACVSGDARHTDEVLSRIVDFVVRSRFDAEVLDHHIEIISLAELGDG